MSNNLTVVAPRHLPATRANWQRLDQMVGVAVDEWTRLLPVETCRAVIAELEMPRPAAPREIALDHASLVVGSYPAHRHVGDPDIYIRAIVSLFGEHPADIGREAVELLTRSSKFLPSRAEVNEALQAIVTKRRAVAYTAKRMLAETERREHLRRVEAERAESPIDPGEFTALLNRLGAAMASTEREVGA